MTRLSGAKAQLRQDITSGEWVLFSADRGKRPEQFKPTKGLGAPTRDRCIFEDPKKAGGGKLIASYPDEDKWRVQVVPNKFPILKRDGYRVKVKKRAFYNYIEGYGAHELVITKNHTTNFSKLSISDANLLFAALKDRYNEIAKDKNIHYISIYHNWGSAAGASIYHPHYQILSTPIIPPMAARAIANSRAFKNKNKQCAHCFQIKMAKKDDRIIHEDELSIAFAPFAPKEPFEFRVSPKHHSPYFEDSTEYELNSMIKSLQSSLLKLERIAKGVSYNFYIHTAPTNSKGRYGFYHWHIQVVPREVESRLGMSGGFELATGMQVNSIFPEVAVKTMNRAK